MNVYFRHLSIVLKSFIYTENIKHKKHGTRHQNVFSVNLKSQSYPPALQLSKNINSINLEEKKKHLEFRIKKSCIYVRSNYLKTV